MDLRQLEYFVSVAKTENMGASAEELHISQPALSMAIKKIEEELGTNLFDRKNRSIVLNSNGRFFLKHAQNCLRDIEEGKKELEAHMTKKNNKVTISCPVYYLTGLIFESFFAIHPETSVESTQVQYWKLEEALLNKRIDVCITTVNVQNDKIENVFLADREIGLLCPKTHPFAAKKTLKISDMKNEKILSYPDTYQPRYDLELLCKKRDFRPNIVFESESTTTLINMCKKGVGLFCMSYEAAGIMDLSDVVFIPFDEPDLNTSVKLYMLSLANNPKPLVADLKQVIIDTIKNS